MLLFQGVWEKKAWETDDWKTKQTSTSFAPRYHWWLNYSQPGQRSGLSRNSIYPDFELCDHCPIAVTCSGCKRDNKVPHWLLKTSLQLFSNIIQLLESQSKSWILTSNMYFAGFQDPTASFAMTNVNKIYTKPYLHKFHQDREPGMPCLVQPPKMHHTWSACLGSTSGAQFDVQGTNAQLLQCTNRQQTGKRKLFFWWRWGWVPGMTSCHGWIQPPATSNTFSDCH